MGEGGGSAFDPNAGGDSGLRSGDSGRGGAVGGGDAGGFGAGVWGGNDLSIDDGDFFARGE
ncbi:hypothetical protein C0431_08570 [bacterium]|nr:hypothetical protein [bacterium]